MTDRRGRKVHVVVLDGEAHNAYETSLAFALTLDDLMHAIAIAATTSPRTQDRFDGNLSHSPIAQESYWSERDTERARAVAASLGPGRIYTTARSELRAHGEGWRSTTWDEIFPAEVARERANELFPMLRKEGNPFAPPPDLHDE